MHFKIELNMRLCIKIGLLILMVSCKQTDETSKLNIDENDLPKTKEQQDSIIKEHLENGAWKMGLYSREWQNEIDKGLAKDSTIAYLWQQKAMPLFKQGKYEVGMMYLDKAVKYDKNNEWQEYRAFMKCIFSKTYKEAIIDFEACKRKKGNSYVMDHSYNFYIALSKIQLNEFSEAENLLDDAINQELIKHGAEWIHYLDLFYLGISRYEQGKYEEAIDAFDRTIQKYPGFAEALYYKGSSLQKTGKKEEAKKIMDEAIKYGKQGNSIKEDNSIYERYPYQIRWNLWD